MRTVAMGVAGAAAAAEAAAASAGLPPPLAPPGAAAAATGATGALLMIADPAEEDFPFRGRTLFEEPGGQHRQALFGRAEAAQVEYAQRLAAHRAAMREVAAAHGFIAVLHRTDRSAAPTLSMLVAALGERR